MATKKKTTKSRTASTSKPSKSPARTSASASTKKPSKAAKPAKHAKAAKAAKPASDEAVVNAYGNRFRRCLPLTESQLAEVEAELGIDMPGDLRALFLSCNGGHPEKPYFFNGKHEVEVGSILPVRSTAGWKREAFEVIYQRSVARMGFPTTLIPFAYDTGNANFFCVETSSGDVVYWILDQPDHPVKRLAGSLEAFLSKLEERPY